MATPDLFQELKKALQELDDFLASPPAQKVKDVLQASGALLEEFGVPVVKLIDSVIKLLNDLKKEIDNFDLSDIGLEDVAEFGKKLNDLATAIMALPFVEEDPEIKKLTQALSSLDSFEEAKAEIQALITSVIGHLESLKPKP